MQAYFNKEEYGEHEEIKIQKFGIDEFNGGLKFKIVTEMGSMVIILDDVREQSRFTQLFQKAMEKAVVVQLSKTLEELKSRASNIEFDNSSEFDC